MGSVLSSVGFSNGTSKSLNIKEMSIKAIVRGLSSSVTITMKLHNNGTENVYGKMLFPIDEKAVISDYQLKIQGRVTVARLKSNDEANQELEKAIQDGKTGSTLEHPKSNVFVATIGNLPSKQIAEITLTYSTLLSVEDFKVRFCIPTTMKPKFIPDSDFSTKSVELNTLEFTDKFNCKVSLTIDIQMETKIVHVSSCQNIATTDFGDFKKTVFLEDLKMDQDFVCLISTEETEFGRLIEEKSDKGSAMMLTFLPKFKIGEIKAEIIFLVDCSGSMRDNMSQAKRALKFFMKSLPTDCYFNIVSFHSGYETLFSNRSHRFEKDEFNAATRFIDKLCAEGGTNLKEPLELVLKNDPIEGYQRQIIVLTDGDVSNSKDITDLIKLHHEKARVFALGLGASADHHLVNGMASAGKGTARFANQKEDLQSKVIELLENAKQPCFKDVSIEWESVEKEQSVGPVSMVVPINNSPTFFGHGMPQQRQDSNHIDFQFIQSPGYDEIPSIFSGEPFYVFALLPKETSAPDWVEVSAINPSNNEKFTVKICKTVVEGNVVSPLAAHQIIKRLEEDDPKNRELIIQLSCLYNVASSLTKFIAVDANGKPNQHAMLRMVEQQISLQRPLSGKKDTSLCRTASVDQVDSATHHGQMSSLSSRLQNFIFQTSSDQTTSSDLPKKESAADKLKTLQELLEYDGSLMLTEDFASLFKTTVDEIKKVCQCHRFSTESWTIALGLALISKLTSFETKKDWKPIMEKMNEKLEQYYESDKKLHEEANKFVCEKIE